MYLYIDPYMQQHNRMFVVQLASGEGAHRGVLHDDRDCDLIFSIHHKHKLIKELSLQDNNTVSQLKVKGCPTS